jgi:hypothetical protein
VIALAACLLVAGTAHRPSQQERARPPVRRTSVHASRPSAPSAPPGRPQRGSRSKSATLIGGPRPARTSTRLPRLPAPPPPSFSSTRNIRKDARSFLRTLTSDHRTGSDNSLRNRRPAGRSPTSEIVRPEKTCCRVRRRGRAVGGRRRSRSRSLTGVPSAASRTTTPCPCSAPARDRVGRGSPASGRQTVAYSNETLPTGPSNMDFHLVSATRPAGCIVFGPAIFSGVRNCVEPVCQGVRRFPRQQGRVEEPRPGLSRARARLLEIRVVELGVGSPRKVGDGLRPGGSRG